MIESRCRILAISLTIGQVVSAIGLSACTTNDRTRTDAGVTRADDAGNRDAGLVDPLCNGLFSNLFSGGAAGLSREGLSLEISGLDDSDAGSDGGVNPCLIDTHGFAPRAGMRVAIDCVLQPNLGGTDAAGADGFVMQYTRYNWYAAFFGTSCNLLTSPGIHRIDFVWGS